MGPWTAATFLRDTCAREAQWPHPAHWGGGGWRYFRDGPLTFTALHRPTALCSKGLEQDAYRGHARSDILQQLEPFRAKAEIIAGESGDVAARPRETLDEATADRVEDLHEHDRNRPGLLLECGDHRGRVRHNRVRLHRH